MKLHFKCCTSKIKELSIQKEVLKCLALMKILVTRTKKYALR